MPTQTRNRRKGLTEPAINRSGEWLLAGHYDPEFVQAVVAELDRLAALSANWDREDAPQIDRRIIDAAKVFVRSLPENLAYRPNVVPMSPGNLQLEWHHGQKVLELEFENPQTIRFLQYDPNAGIEEEDSFGVDEVEKAVDLIQWFMSGTCV
jgi:hypothetical protein